MQQANIKHTQSNETSPSLEITGINWTTSIFLVSTLVVALIATPIYLWYFGAGLFELTLFLVWFALGGMSITVGYHRLLAHRAFNAAAPVRLLTALFGASTFQASALNWCADHRYHHKYTDRDGDPHDPHSIRRGFFWAHMGWLLVYVDPRLKRDNIADLKRDPILAWQHRHYLPIAITMGFLVPMAVGAAWSASAGGSLALGMLAGFLWGGCTRIVVLQHCTFLINSLAHVIGRRPYDSTNSSRDSALLALFTFGEGYHNYHHAFQTDYRNGVRFWHWDPSKWAIWLLARVGLASNLRRVPAETIRLARVREKRRRLEHRLASRQSELTQHVATLLQELETKLEHLHVRCRVQIQEYSRVANRRLEAPRQRVKELRRELADSRREFRRLLRQWRLAHRLALAMA